MAVRAENVIGTYPFEVQPGACVDVLVYGCCTVTPVAPAASSEHQDVGWLDPEDIAPDQVPTGYQNAIRRWRAAHAD